MLKLMITAVCCILSLSVCAQFTVSGTVQGGNKNEILPGATVQLRNTKFSGITDKDGRFQFAGIPVGTYVLSATFLGYHPFVRTIDVNADVDVTLIQLTEQSIIADEVIVSALRATDKTPTTFINIGKAEIGNQNYGQDLPLLLNWTPSLVTTSDAGTGVGYTGVRIRGSDASHINVTINGIPYNDSESQSVYWVDVPDVASSTQSIQIQRGVGTSTNGAGAFGGSINLETNALTPSAYAEVGNSYGSFNTHKHTLKFGTGLINNAWAFDGRISKIRSDGYVERASSDLDSYYLSGGYYGKKTLIKAIVFGGHELTYQSWYGIDPEMMKIDRRYNYAGAIYNDDGTVRFYDRQVDDYGQDHYQLHLAHQFNQNWNVNAALHYTYGRGYYEEYNQGKNYADLGLQNLVIGNDTIKSGDFITRKWLKNRFYGATWSIRRAGKRTAFTFGGALNKYGNAKHYGEIIWAQYAGPTNLRDHYYDALSEKTDFNIYSKLGWDVTPALNVFVDLQYRRVGYQSAGINDDQSNYNIDDTFNFFNPKLGLSYSLLEGSVLYASLAVANREPSRADYLGGTEKPRSERLNNIEAGWRKKTDKFTLEASYYLMNYRDQLVLTGQLNDGGYPIRANVGKSYRTGIELSAMIKLIDKLSWGINTAVSRNRNKELAVSNDDGTTTSYKNTSIVLSPDWIAGSQLAWIPIKNAQVMLLTKYVGTQYLDNTARSLTKLDSYLINDVRLSYSIKPTFVKEIEFGILLNNIFGTAYSSNGTVYGDTPYYYPQAGRNYLMRMNVKF